VHATTVDDQVFDLGELLMNSAEAGAYLVLMISERHSKQREFTSNRRILPVCL